MEEVEQEMPGARDVSARASRVLLDWIANPRVDRELGRKGLLEVSRRCDVVQGRDYTMNLQEILKHGRKAYAGGGMKEVIVVTIVCELKWNIQYDCIWEVGLVGRYNGNILEMEQWECA